MFYIPEYNGSAGGGRDTGWFMDWSQILFNDPCPTTFRQDKSDHLNYPLPRDYVFEVIIRLVAGVQRECGAEQLDKEVDRK